MAIMGWKLNRYSKKDYRLLKKSLEVKGGLDYVAGGNPGVNPCSEIMFSCAVYDKSRNFSIGIMEKELHTIVMTDKEVMSYSPRTDYLKAKTDFVKLIREEPLESVPLYINQFPNVVAWRMRIGH